MTPETRYPWPRTCRSGAFRPGAAAVVRVGCYVWQHGIISGRSRRRLLL